MSQKHPCPLGTPGFNKTSSTNPRLKFLVFSNTYLASPSADAAVEAMQVAARGDAEEAYRPRRPYAAESTATPTGHSSTMGHSWAAAEHCARHPPTTTAPLWQPWQAGLVGGIAEDTKAKRIELARICHQRCQNGEG